MSVTRTFTVTVVSTDSGNKYFIDGVQQATLELVEGATFRFDQSDSSNSGHPFPQQVVVHILEVVSIPQALQQTEHQVLLVLTRKFKLPLVHQLYTIIALFTQGWVVKQIPLILIFGERETGVLVFGE
jgi:hypothetical protein